MTINLKFYSILSAVISSIGLSLCESQCMAQVNNSTVKNFEIEKFVGKWYELARYDHFFELGMTNVTADYTLLDDGKIRVVNSGIKNGRKKEIVGKAKYPDPQKHPGKLAVSFFLWFYSDYYVMYVDKDYKHVIIGSSSDKYLWIMSRTPSVSDAEFDTLLQIVKSRGYDISNLIIDRQ